MGGNRKRYQQSTNADQKSIDSVFDCHLSPVWRQTAIENTVFIDFCLRSSIVLAFSIAAYPVWEDPRETSNLLAYTSRVD